VHNSFGFVGNRGNTNQGTACMLNPMQTRQS